MKKRTAQEIVAWSKIPSADRCVFSDDESGKIGLFVYTEKDRCVGDCVCTFHLNEIISAAKEKLKQQKVSK